MDVQECFKALQAEYERRGTPFKNKSYTGKKAYDEVSQAMANMNSEPASEKDQTAKNTGA